MDEALIGVSLYKLGKAVIAAFALWGLLRAFDAVTGIRFKKEWESFSERSRAIYYSARLFSFCLFGGLLLG